MILQFPQIYNISGAIRLAEDGGDMTRYRSISSSLKFTTILKRSLRENNGAGMRHVYEILDKKLGKYLIDHSFQNHCDKFIDDLHEKGRATNTISNYQSVIMRVLNHAYRLRMIDDVPVRSFNIKREFRDRVWTPVERDRIFEAMKQLNSHLFWSVYFCERNPIRGRSDLWTLIDENLVLEGIYSPYIRFRPQKTSKTKPRDTYLPEIDQQLIEYFKWKRKVVPECKLLFPRIWSTRLGEYRWAPMGNPRKHWQTICQAAGVEDLHFHDLKHVAISWMLHARNEDGTPRYTTQDLKDLGIQYSDKAISVYLNLEAESVLSRLSRFLPNQEVFHHA